MIQFYFLSIVLNVLCGFILVTDSATGGKEELEVRNSLSLDDETVRLVLGIASMVVGLLKLLSWLQVPGNLPIIGDIIPALTGFAAGMILCFEYAIKHSSKPEAEQGPNFFISNKKLFGFAAVIAGGLHFLFPAVLLL